jgi:hypothetical protein
VLGRVPEPVRSGAGEVGGDPLLAQAALKQARQLRLVLDQQDAHGTSVLSPMSRG